MLKFDDARDAARRVPSYFTKLLTPAELKSKGFVSRQPPSGYGGVLVGSLPSPESPRDVASLDRGICTGHGRAQLFETGAVGQPAQATLTLYDPAKQSARELRAKTVRWLPI